MVKMQSWYFWN